MDNVKSHLGGQAGGGVGVQRPTQPLVERRELLPIHAAQITPVNDDLAAGDLVRLSALPGE